MLKKTYLSIDLDYWFTNDECCRIKQLKNVLRSIKNIKNIKIVGEHHRMLSHINSVAPDKIIHVDYHQDIGFPTERNQKDFSMFCGNFLYYVKNRQSMDFEWYYPEYSAGNGKGLGYCTSSYDPNPNSKKNHIFKTQIRRLGLPPHSTLSSCSAVGISISRNWWYVLNTDRQYSQMMKSIRDELGIFGVKNGEEKQKRIK